MAITMASVFGWLSRVDMVPSHHSSTDSRVTSDCASSALWGSSTTTRSPPSPVAAPPTEVAIR
jgi:hypothetical protein